eukprot:TRINITY_DN5049_c0_g1_i1.p1 TRINITY_DN5049_c0_g1~~TRINITY_DN5049_c0_g1_i1.p1  ORF type:complete len:264 (-),score=53.61 TRINITY_DN5049_c0_g1_i1:464-1255(-)
MSSSSDLFASSSGDNPVSTHIRTFDPFKGGETQSGTLEKRDFDSNFLFESEKGDDHKGNDFNSDFYSGKYASTSDYAPQEVTFEETYVPPKVDHSNLYFQGEEDDVIDNGGSLYGEYHAPRRGDGSKAKVWHLEYYQEFFDVDTSDVLWRLLFSLIPFNQKFAYLVKSKPDLWGPFWISTTLIFTMVACGGFAYYLSSIDYVQWSYQFAKIGIGAGVIYGYVLLIPLAFWVFAKWSEISIKLVEIITVYGYSLFIFTPVAVFR